MREDGCTETIFAFIYHDRTILLFVWLLQLQLMAFK